MFGRQTESIQLAPGRAPGVLTIAAAVLVCVTAVAGLINPTAVHGVPSRFVSTALNDVVTMLLAVPVLLASVRRAQRGSLPWLSLWGASCFYLAYNYVPYALDSVAQFLVVPYLLIVAMSLASLIMLLQGHRATSAESSVDIVGTHKGASVVLVGLALFVLLYQSASAYTSGSNGIIERSLLFADIVLAVPFLTVAGVALWLRRRIGRLLAAIALWSYAMLSLGLVFLFAAQMVLDPTSVAPSDLVAVGAMTVICVIPGTRILRDLHGGRRDGSA